MSLSGLGNWSFLGVWMVASAVSTVNVTGAKIVSGPGEAGLRAAIEAAQPDEYVLLTPRLELQAHGVVDKRITITVNPVEAWRIWIEARFDGAMLDLSTDGIVLDGLKMNGSVQTDALGAEGTAATLRNCIISNCRQPVMSNMRGATLQ